MADKMPPIVEAARSGNLGQMQELLKAGADVLCEDEHSWTPSQHAAFRGHIAIVEEILHSTKDAQLNFDLDDYDKGVACDRDQALHLAAFSGQAAIVKLLLAAAADINDGADWENDFYIGNTLFHAWEHISTVVCEIETPS